MQKVEKGDMLTIEVEVLRTWAVERSPFPCSAHPGLTTIPGDSPQIVGIGKTKQKASRRRADA